VAQGQERSKARDGARGGGDGRRQRVKRHGAWRQRRPRASQRSQRQRSRHALLVQLGTIELQYESRDGALGGGRCLALLVTEDEVPEGSGSCAGSLWPR